MDISSPPNLTLASSAIQPGKMQIAYLVVIVDEIMPLAQAIELIVFIHLLDGHFLCLVKMYQLTLTRLRRAEGMMALGEVGILFIMQWNKSSEKHDTYYIYIFIYL